MDDTKPALASTSVWGSLLALVGVFAPLLLNVVGVKAPVDQAAAHQHGDPTGYWRRRRHRPFMAASPPPRRSPG